MTEINIYGIGVINQQDLLVEGSDGLDGEYKYKTRGSSGDIYINSDNTVAIKINHQPQEEEVNKQIKVQSLAPQIYYHYYPYTIHMKEDNKVPDQYDNVGIIFMEYLDESKWSPFPSNPNNIQLNKLFDSLFKLVNTYKLKNTFDITGHSGHHIFITNKEPYEIKLIDYDNFKPCTGNKKDFLDVVSAIARSGAFRINVTNRILFYSGEYALQHFKTKKSMKIKTKSPISKVKPIISKERYHFKKATKRKDKKNKYKNTNKRKKRKATKKKK